jgi:hypothetical protein
MPKYNTGSRSSTSLLGLNIDQDMKGRDICMFLGNILKMNMLVVFHLQRLHPLFSLLSPQLSTPNGYQPAHR